LVLSLYLAKEKTATKDDIIFLFDDKAKKDHHNNKKWQVLQTGRHQGRRFTHGRRYVKYGYPRRGNDENSHQLGAHLAY